MDKREVTTVAKTLTYTQNSHFRALLNLLRRWRNNINVIVNKKVGSRPPLDSWRIAGLYLHVFFFDLSDVWLVKRQAKGMPYQSG